MSEGDSYSQIVRSSSIIGGAEAINYLIGAVRVKAIAVLLGPTGVGIIGLYTSATGLLANVTGLGLQGSAVRQVAVAAGQGDELAVAKTIRTLRLLCWATGTAGWLLSAALALPLSRLLFQSTAHAWAFVALGGVLLLSALNGGQHALLQGLRRIGDIARAQVAAAVINTAIAIGVYIALGEAGIVPVLVMTAAVSLVISWLFVRRVHVAPGRLGWKDAVTHAKPMLGLGAAMMSSGVLLLLLDLYTRTLISRQLGLDGVGIYQAAWALSGLFAGFVLAAMGTDFYPRLTSVIKQEVAAAKTVNEQTEIGILLALPGLLATIALAEWVIWAFYSAEFAPASEVLVWMVLGVYGRVLSWPLGYIQLALGAAKWFVTTESVFIGIQAALVTLLVPHYGVLGAAYAFAGCYALYTLAMAWVGHRLIRFRWSAAVLRMFVVSGMLVVAAIAVHRFMHDIAGLLSGGLIAAVGSLWCLRNLVLRLGPGHQIVRWVQSIPLLRHISRWGTEKTQP